MKILERVRQRAEAARATAADEYGHLVALIAHEQSEPEPQDVLRIIDDAGKSTDDLAADVTRLQERITAASEVSQLGEVQAESDALASRIDAIGRERAAAIAAYDSQLRRANSEFEQIQAGIRDLKTKSRQLREGASDESKARAARAAAGVAGAKSALDGERAELARHQRNAERELPAVASRYPDDRDRLAAMRAREEAVEVRRREQAEIAVSLVRVAEAEAIVGEWEQEFSDANAGLLVP